MAIDVSKEVHLDLDSLYFRQTGFTIDEERSSDTASLLFTQNSATKDNFVLKILHPYKDTRYRLESVENRQACQLEALRWNKKFSPDIYIGLAPYYDWVKGKKSIQIGEIIKEPELTPLDPQTEYALIMKRLPGERQLDILLRNQDGASLQPLLKILTDYLVVMHDALNTPQDPYDEHNNPWGSFEQLKSKLHHNLGLFSLIEETELKDWYAQYKWLGDELLQIFNQPQFRIYVEHRRQGGYIRHCHGDLKSPNIWILSDDSVDQSVLDYRVNVLDAIDFNPSYSNIDVLSDFAMLVIDIQARTNNVEMANQMIDQYLQYTVQQDTTARILLNYYLVEKALVGAAVSIRYDKLFDLGKAYLKVAQMRIEDLRLQVLQLVY